MKHLILLLTVSLLLFTLPRPTMSQVVEGKGATVKSSPMPAERVKATFEDARVKTFMSVVEKSFGGKCSIPDFTKTEATLTQIGSGDFSSSYYDIIIPCPGDNGLVGVQINVEFSPPLGSPLNLVLSLQYRL
jgi:hypothetical protein